MRRVRTRGENIRRYILENVEKYPKEISRVTAQKFDITRQAVHKHLQRLTEENALTETGKTRNRAYKLCPLLEWRHTYKISPELAEDVVWTNDIRPVLGQLPDNAMNIWHYGFTEMFNNAIDHSGSPDIFVRIRKTAADTEMLVMDDGVGIFKKIQMALGLLDERHAIFELHKGKLTTDPKIILGKVFFLLLECSTHSIFCLGAYILPTNLASQKIGF